MEKVTVEVFSDILCVWAYGAQARIDQLKHDFGNRIELKYRFIPLFAATRKRIEEGWKSRGGAEGFNQHIQDVVQTWKHVSVHPKLWLHDMPPSSNSAHLFAKAAQQLSADGEISSTPQAAHKGRTLFEELVWRIRCHFFEQNRNISSGMKHLYDVVAGARAPTWPCLEQNPIT